MTNSKYLNLVFVFFLVVNLYGCVNDTGSLKIKGKVFDENTKTGLPQKTIIIHALAEINDKSENVVAQFSTDSSGNFSYKLKKLKGARYYNFCMAGDSDYVFTTRTLGLLELRQNAEFLSFSLKKLTDLKINVYRKSTKPSRDTISLIWQSDGVYGASLYPYKIYNNGRNDNSFGQKSDLNLYWIGGNVNSTIITKVFASTKTELTWKLYRNGRKMIFIDTITCKQDFENIVNFSY